MNYQEIQENIFKRLGAVDVSSGVVDKATVGRALDQYLHTLKLTRRPITWVKDAQHACHLAAQIDPAFVKGELHDRIFEVFRHTAEREHQVWAYPRAWAIEAGYGRQLRMVKALVSGNSGTTDSLARTSLRHDPAWSIAADSLEYAARAAAECAWAQVIRDQITPYVYHLDKWLPFVTAFEAGLWCFWITPTEVIALPRPRLELNAAKQLHCDNGPAVHWDASEQQFFFLNDVHVPRKIVATAASELDPHLLLQEQNTEVRREIVRKIGIERVCEVLKAQCLDRRGNYELLLLDLQDGRTRPFLKMKNPSIGVFHIEGVAPDCRTVAEALAWRNQSEVPPSVLT